jgi:hypothetical protein
MKDVTVLMTTFDRDCLLQLGLQSIRRWNPDVRIIVLNDGIPGNVEHICRLLDAEHLFTGHRNKEKIYWRVPGYAFNIGIKSTDSSIVVLTCAEMWHVTDCLTPMVSAVRDNNKVLAIPEGKDDMDNRYLPNLDNEIKYNECVALKTELPFLMAISRQELLDIGGYDEDFVGQSFDDDDIVERLQANGCCYKKVDARCVHLYHPRYCHDKRTMGRWALNKKLYEERKGQIVRNVDREWGVL